MGAVKLSETEKLLLLTLAQADAHYGESVGEVEDDTETMVYPPGYFDSPTPSANVKESGSRVSVIGGDWGAAKGHTT